MTTATPAPNRHRTRPRAWTATLALAIALAACGSAASSHRPAPPRHPAPDPRTISLTEIPGNAITHNLWRVVVHGDLLSVQSAPRAVEAVPPGFRTVRRVVLTRGQLRVLVRDVAAVGNAPFAIGAVCHHLPVGDVGGLLLTIDDRRTNCPPPSTGPLVKWLSAYRPRSRPASTPPR